MTARQAVLCGLLLFLTVMHRGDEAYFRLASAVVYGGTVLLLVLSLQEQPIRWPSWPSLSPLAIGTLTVLGMLVAAWGLAFWFTYGR